MLYSHLTSRTTPIFETSLFPPLSWQNYLANLKSLEDELGRITRDLDVNFTTTDDGTHTGTTALTSTSIPLAGEEGEDEAPLSPGSSEDILNRSLPTLPPSTGLGMRTAEHLPDLTGVTGAHVIESGSVRPTSDRPLMEDLYAALGLAEDEGMGGGYLATGTPAVPLLIEVPSC